MICWVAHLHTERSSKHISRLRRGLSFGVHPLKSPAFAFKTIRTSNFRFKWLTTANEVEWDAEEWKIPSNSGLKRDSTSIVGNLFRVPFALLLVKKTSVAFPQNENCTNYSYDDNLPSWNVFGHPYCWNPFAWSAGISGFLVCRPLISTLQLNGAVNLTGPHMQDCLPCSVDSFHPKPSWDGLGCCGYVPASFL